MPVTNALPCSPTLPAYYKGVHSTFLLFFRLCFGLLAPPLFSLPRKCLTIAVVDPHESITPLVVFPVKGCLDRGSGQPCLIEEIKGHSHDQALHLFVPGFPAGVSQREIGENESRDATFLYDVPGGTHDHGSNAVLFKMSSNQTHGLVTHRSEPGEEYGINAILAAPLEDLWGVIPQCFASTISGGHPIKTC